VFSKFFFNKPAAVVSIYCRYKLRADKLIALLVACNHKYFALCFLKYTIQ